jgi:predicted dehydrogenase
MADFVRLGIVGGGWPGAAQAKGCQAAGGFKLAAIADLIPERRRKMMGEFGIPKQYAMGEELIADKEIDAVSICAPNDLHQSLATAALAAGKHVICESPPSLDAGGARKMLRARDRYGKVLMYAFQRRFGGHEQAARAAIRKDFAGEVFHVRAGWTRTRGIPTGTGWYTSRERAGGGALMDLGIHMLDLTWSLLGEPAAETVFATTQRRFAGDQSDSAYDVEDSGSVLVKFAGGKTLELAVAWALNQPPQQNGAFCRVYGEQAAIEVYTPSGATLYRDFKANGDAKGTLLKPPKTTHYPAMMRHFRLCTLGQAECDMGAEKGLRLMEMMDGIYRSAEMGRSVEIKSGSSSSKGVRAIPVAASA